MKTETWVIIAILVLGVAVYQGWIDLGAKEVPTPQENIPSDMQSTVTLKFLDDLATTTTNVNAEWIAFNGDGTYFASGTAGTDGLDTFTGIIDSRYTVYAYNSSSNGYLAKKVDISTGNKPRVTKTIKLVKRSGVENKNFIDPVDLNANISLSAGETQMVRFQYKANVSNAAVGKPAIVLDANGTSVIEDIAVVTSGYSEVDCPDRLSPSATGRKLYCFQRDSDLLASEGLEQVDFSIKAKSGGGVGTSDWIEGYVIDEALWLEPGYETIDDIHFGFEDKDDNDVGAGDSGTDKVYFSD